METYINKINKSINLKTLNIDDFNVLIELLQKYPELLRENIDFFNFIDTYVINSLQKNEKHGFSTEFLKRVLILGLKLNKGSKKFFQIIEKTLDFSKISSKNPEFLLVLINSLSGKGKTMKFSKEFVNECYFSLISVDFKTFKGRDCLELMYNSALLNIAPIEFYKKCIENLKFYGFQTNLEKIKFLWSLMYFSLRFPEEKLENSLFDDIIKTYDSKEIIRKTGYVLVLAYKMHEIELFLKKCHPESYEKYWKNQVFNKLEEELFMGGIDKQESLLQSDVKIILKIANIQFEMEKRIEKIYIIDFLIEKEILLEVDGPMHFTFNETDELFEDGKRLVKREVLKQMGYKIVSLNYKEWYELKGVNAKINFINEKIYGKNI